MADNEYAPNVNISAQSDAGDLKKKVAEQSLKSAEQVQDDPARSSLHYGDDGNGDGAEEVMPDGTDPFGVGMDQVERPVETQSGTSSADASGTTPDATASVGAPPVGDSDVQGPVNASPRSGGGRSNQTETDLDLIQADATATPQAAIAQPADTTAEPNAPQSTPDDFGTQATLQNETTENAAPTAVELSNSAIAENVQGAVLGHLTVSDADVGDTHSFMLSDERFEVVDGAVKLKDGVSLSVEEAASLTLEITATDSSGGAFTQQFAVDVVDMPDVSVGSGFHARYFDTDQTLNKLDDIDWQSDPAHQELVDQIDYTNGRGSFWEGGDTDTFGAQITGNIEVTEAGTFDFFLGGDDGVVLLINGQEVIEYNGLQSYRTRSGEIELEPGTHSIEVRYFENYGHAGLKLEWEGPGTDGRELVTAPSVDDLQTVTGMPLHVQLDVEPGVENASYTLEGLPPGSVVQLGEHTLDVDETGTVDITGQDMSVVQITPPIEFAGDVSAVLKTTVSLETGGVATHETDISFEVQAVDAFTPELSVQTGFRASYFDVDHSLNKLDQIDWSDTPTHEEVVGEINYANGSGSFWDGGATDTFGAKITGDITVEEGGVYDFYVGGDDGVVLYINGEEVVDNDGEHGFRTRTGEIELEPGTHEIEVRYFENYGRAGLKLEWEGPDTNGRELVQADTELVTEQNGVIDIRLDTSSFGEHGAATISGLPADTILVSGDMTAVADGTDLVLEGWNIDLIEVMPPPGFEGDINVDVTVPFEAFNGAVTDISTAFQMTVTSDDAGSDTPQGPDDLILIEQSNEGVSPLQSWVDHSEGDGGDPEAGSDDILDEPVDVLQDTEQTHETAETYERQDW